MNDLMAEIVARGQERGIKAVGLQRGEIPQAPPLPGKGKGKGKKGAPPPPPETTSSAVRTYGKQYTLEESLQLEAERRSRKLMLSLKRTIGQLMSQSGVELERRVRL